ncbi:MAG: protein kinase [Pyrinomonadaceae bacterium]|nr:protein kinase [Pyrinomonadaceae bacterium]
MTKTPTERWQQLKKLFYDSIELPLDQVDAMLAQACPDDASMREEVKALRRLYDQNPDFMEIPPVMPVGDLLAGGGAMLQKDQTILHFKILTMLGEGGMGEVYLAHDLKLDRRVALKLLPLYFSKDEESLRRFEQEARAASALSHPNVCIIHDVNETEDNRPFIVMEYVEGATLRERLETGGAMRPNEALDIAMQVASALDEAHLKGITHRDIKPENIMLRNDGQAKVLDFGVAKLAEGLAYELADEKEGSFRTAPGSLLGTVSYMSPEQARGLPVDARTDIWSLGVVLYEMLTGRTPFGGDTPSDTLAAILEHEPAPFVSHAPGLPGELERIITNALTKDREKRYKTIKELLTDLHHLKTRLEERTAKQGHPGPTAADSKIRSTGTRNAVFATVALVIIAAIIIYTYYSTQNDKGSLNSIAVLPFVNKVNDPDTEYLSDGITESIITNLSRISKLNVIAYTTVSPYKGSSIDPLAVGRKLKVQAVLVGKLARRGDNLTVSVELMDVRNSKHIWGEQYQRQLSDILVLQKQLSREISEQLQLSLTGAEQKQLAKSYTDNTEAYQLYLKGRFFWNKRTIEDFKKAIEYFRRAIEKDPNYALAYAGLSDTYLLRGQWSDITIKEAVEKARPMAIRALELDENLAEAHAALALVKVYGEYDWAAADRELKRAIELNPSYAKAHYDNAYNLSVRGRYQAAVTEINRAIELDPLSTVYIAQLAEVFFYARQYDEAMAQSRKALEMDPNYLGGILYLGWVYEQKGMYEEAIEQFEKYHRIAGDPESADVLGHAYAKAGKRDKALKLLNEMKKQYEREDVVIDPSAIALIHLGLGQKDLAFQFLYEALEFRSPNLCMLKVHPYFDSIRDDPRFADLLRRVNLLD